MGVKTNRTAIGARITMMVDNAGSGTRSIHRTVSSGGSFASPLQQHVGLGKAARIREIEIWWPTSHTRQRFSNVEKTQVLKIRELAEDYARLERTPLPLGGSRREDPPVPARRRSSWTRRNDD